MNRRQKEQRRKDKRQARQVYNRSKVDQSLIGQAMHAHAHERCPACNGGPREPVSCDFARLDDPAAHEDWERWEREVGNVTHTHLRCTKCDEVGYLVVEKGA